MRIQCPVNDDNESSQLDLHGPARYRIVVQGRLDPAWVAQIAGLAMRVEAVTPPLTVVWGRLRDQAALHGVLRHLYAMGFPLVSVALLRPGDDPDASGT
jgi:hypothetical protein